MPTIDQVPTGQNQKEATINALFEAAGVAASFGIRRSQTANLNLGLYGGICNVDGVNASIAANTYALIDATNPNYVFLQRSGTGTISIGVNNTGHPPGSIPLYEIVTASGQISSVSDRRRFPTLGGTLSKAVTSADVTLTNAEAAAPRIITTGTLTGNRALILPAIGGPWQIENTCAGPHTLTVKTAAGTGVVVAPGARAVVYADGTNIVRGDTDPRLQDIAYSASITPNASAGDVIDVGTLTGNLTINAPTSVARGRVLTFMFEQDGTGGRTITWDAAFKKAADGAGTAGQKAATQFVYDGAHWLQLGGAIAWT